MVVLLMSCGRKKMKNTPNSYENGDVNCICRGLGCSDLQLDFSNDASLRQLEAAKMRGAKNKKAWIRALSLFFHCRQKKKKKSEEEEEAPLKAKALKLSAPLFGNGSKFGELRHKMRSSSSSSSSSSGYLSFCFTPAKAEETEVPYRSLGHQSHALGAQAFGPIYLVT